ncbi:MAG: hypothetical protein DMF69_01020 [Acidobacteria bacterium]|nr:MAG: hypothetical protein DMF69_01020 [Acidobacteriota bacterium]
MLDTTDVSRVELQFLANTQALIFRRYHRLQPRGVSISRYTPLFDLQIPPASAAWSFNFTLHPAV